MITSPFFAAAALSLKGGRTSEFRSLDHTVEDGPPQSHHFELAPKALLDALRARRKN